jgi:hypothetical protein
MRTSKKLTAWAFGALSVTAAITAAISIQTFNHPASAQPSGIAGLTPAQLKRLQSMQGQFVYESGISRPELWRSIEAGTKGLEPAQARRTRAQLEQLLGPPPHVELALEGDAGAEPSLAIQEGRAKASAPANGQARALVPKGSRADAQLQLSQQLLGNTLLRVVEGKGFRQERRFTLSGDANSLTLEIRVSGPMLANPLSTSALYRRL